MTDGVVRKASLALVGLVTLVRAAANLTGYYLIDDYVFIARASSAPLLSTEQLLEIHLGHLMPGAFAVNWLVVHAAPFAYWLPAVLMALAWGGCLLMMRQVLLEWLGPRPALLIPLAFYAITPLTLQVSGWWAAALNSLPMQFFALVAIWALRRHDALPRGAARRTYGVVIVASVLLALAFFEKSVLIPPLLVGLAVAWSPVTPWWRALAHWVRSAPVLGGTLVAVALGYVAVYAVLGLRDQGDVERTPAGMVAGMWTALTENLVPTMAGGPLEFGSGPLFLIETPPEWLGPVSAVLVIALMVTAVVVGGTALRLLVVTAGYGLLVAFTVTLGRAEWLVLVLRAIRYFADAAIPVTLLLAAVTVGVIDALPGWRGRITAGALAAPIAVVVGLASLVTSVNFYRQVQDARARDAASRALQSLAELPRESALLDQYVPTDIISSLYGRFALSSAMFDLVRDRPPIGPQTDRLLLWRPDGTLEEATVVGPESVSPAPAPCGWPVDDRRTIPLTGPLVLYTHTVALEITAPQATRIDLRIGSGPSESWTIPSGTSTQFRTQVGGDTDAIEVSTTGTPVCIRSVTVGSALLPERIG